MRSSYRGFSPRPSRHLGEWCLSTHADYSLQKELISRSGSNRLFLPKSKTVMIRCQVRGCSWAMVSLITFDLPNSRHHSAELFDTNKRRVPGELLSPFPSVQCYQRMIRFRTVKGSWGGVWFSVRYRGPYLVAEWHHYSTRYLYPWF